jgi:UDP-glucose 4-epimerase
MRIVVTGSAGHLGEALVRVLGGEGHEVVGLDVLASPHTNVVGSIADRALVREAVQGADAVLHAATLHKPHVGSHDRAAFVEINLSGTLNLLEEAVAAGASRFVFTSKTAAEDLCELVHRDHGLPCLILRTSRFCPERDDRDDVRAAYDEANLKLNELLYRRVDLEDVVSAHRCALERAPALGFGRYIVSATTPFTRDDLAELRADAPAVVRRLFPDAEALFAQRGWRLLPSIERVYVNARAREELGWAPEYDFRRALDRLAAGEDHRSPLAAAVGAKGYHAVPTGVSTPARPSARRRCRRRPWRGTSPRRPSAAGHRGVRLALLEGRDADAQAHLRALRRRVQRGLHVLEQLAGHAIRLLGGDPAQEDPELVATEPGGDITGAQPPRQRRADALDHGVAGGVPEPVVDGLELVEVDQQHRAAAAAQQLAAQVLMEAPAVVEPAERVVLGEVPQALLAAAARVDVLHLRDPVDGLALTVEHGGGGEVDPALAARREHAELHPEHRGLAREQPPHALAQGGQIVGMGQLGHRVGADELLARPPDQLDQRLVGLDDPVRLLAADADEPSPPASPRKRGGSARPRR